MAKIENIIGKSIQITNSPTYAKIARKKDFYTNMEFEAMLFYVDPLSSIISLKVGADKKKSRLFSRIYILGQIDGGKAMYNYINQQIAETKEKIGAEEIMLYNLIKIFPDYAEEFTQENLAEFAQLFVEHPITLDTKTVKLAYDLKLIVENEKLNGNLSDKEELDFILESVDSVSNQYHKTKELCLKDKLKTLYEKCTSKKITLDYDMQNAIDELLEKYNNDQITRTDFIDNLTKLKSNNEKT